MNKFVKQQLAKCRVVLPPYDDNTTHMVIPFKTNTIPTQTINTSDKFTIEIKDYIINEPSNFTLSSNWNGGTRPPEHNMIVRYVETRGKMVLVEGTGINTNIYWKGWLPQKGFDVI